MGDCAEASFFKAVGDQVAKVPGGLVTGAGIHRTNGIHVVLNNTDPVFLLRYQNFQQGPRNAVIFASSSSPSRDGRTDFSAKSDMLLHFRIFLTDMAVYSMLPYGPQLLTLVIGYSTLVVWFGHESYQICDSVGPVGARWVQTG